MPTIAEAGLPGYEFTTWHGILAPKNTPRTIVMLLNDHDIIVRLLPGEATELGLSAEDGRIELADAEPDAGPA